MILLVMTMMLTFCTIMPLPLTHIIFHLAILMGILKISRKTYSALHLSIRSSNKNFKVGILPCKKVICFNEKHALHFMLKALFLAKIIKFFS